MKKPKTILLKKFAEEKLGIILWSKLEEIFDAVESGKRKILIRSCNGAGKTAALAAICNWKLKTSDDSLVVTTASSHTQVKRNLWGEIRKQAKNAKLFEPKQITETFIKITDKHYAIGISPALPENAQGFHAEKMLIVVDEATGVSRDIMNALFGNATGKEAQVILAYNPIDTDSFPYEAEHNGDWHLIQISALDHPNIVGQALLPDHGAGASGTDFSPCEDDGRTKVRPTNKANAAKKRGRPAKKTGAGKKSSPAEKIIPVEIQGAVSPEWLNDMLPTWSYEVEPSSKDRFEFNGKYWRRTAEVSARILGEWPDNGGEGFIPMYLVKQSLETAEIRGIKTMGIDIARSGKDETVFAFFDGNTQLPFYSMRSKDLVEIAAKAEEFYRQGWNIIALDDTGVGAGVTDILKSRGVNCHPVNFAGMPKGFLNKAYRKFQNARAEMYFNLDDELKRSQIKLLDNRKLHQEITAIRIETSGEKYLLENKEDIRKRLGRSPDRADATVLARYALKLKERESRYLFF